MSIKNSTPARSRGPLHGAIAGLTRLAEVFERRRLQLAREVGLSDPQWRVLEEIGSEAFMPSLFARSREAHPAAVSRTLRQLQDGGLVEVSISSDDARQRRYRLTARGRRVLDKVRRARERAIDAVWRGLPRKRLEEFARFSDLLAERLEAYARREDE